MFGVVLVICYGALKFKTILCVAEEKLENIWTTDKIRIRKTLGKNATRITDESFVLKYPEEG